MSLFLPVFAYADCWFSHEAAHYYIGLSFPIYYASLFCSTEVYAVGYKKVINHLAQWLLLFYLMIEVSMIILQKICGRPPYVAE